MQAEQPMLEVRTSWWHYFWHLFFFFLLIPPVVAAVKRRSPVLRIYAQRVSLIKGILSHESSEVFVADIRNIDVRQTFWQRLVGIGDINVVTAGTTPLELNMLGVPDPKVIQEQLIALRSTGRAPTTTE